MAFQQPVLLANTIPQRKVQAHRELFTEAAVNPLMAPLIPANPDLLRETS